MDWNWLLLSREGRIPRRVYWLYFILPYTVIAILANLLDHVIGMEEFSPISLIYTLVMLWPSICVGAKRCHDRDKSAWWILIIFAPIIGPIWWLVEFGCLRGTVGPNRFGPDPVEPERLASPA